MKRDDGTYMCVAENPAGIRRALAAVRVIGSTGNRETASNRNVEYRVLTGLGKAE